MENTIYDIIVIGAGAAGLMAAGTAAEAGASVLLLEAMPRAGRKLMITGKGRCNLTSNTAIEEYLENINPVPKFCLPMFSRFFVSDTLRHFHRLGVATIEERGRRIFPRSGRAVDVVDALVNWNTGNGVRFKFERKVKELIIENHKVIGVKLDTGTVFACKNCILATGGRSYPATGSTGDGFRIAAEAGHRIIPSLPALVPLVTAGDLAASMQGLTLKNIEATLYINGKKKKSRFGELLFTGNGLSGPVILSLSRDAVIALHNGHKAEIEVDCKPALNKTMLEARIQRELDKHGNAKFKTMLRSLVPLQMISPLCASSGLNPDKYCNQINAAERTVLLRHLKKLRFEIVDHGGWEDAIITSGGVHLKEINPSTLESKIAAHLFFAGEILDLDAATGGYNLQIAWSSAFAAATAAAERT